MLSLLFVIARSGSDVAIFDKLVADFSIEDCHATLAMTCGGYIVGNMVYRCRELSARGAHRVSFQLTKAECFIHAQHQLCYAKLAVAL